MNHEHTSGQSYPTSRRIGCVSYLNAKPLIDGLVDADDPQILFDVPSRLLGDLESGAVDIALCPVLDYYRSATPLRVVPAGGIACEGSTLTVRLFSRVPIKLVKMVHADTDSHTSVALLQILLDALHGLRPRIVAYHAREHVADGRLIDPPDTMLLIGDKVVTGSPLAAEFAHQLDLGTAWNDLTGLPFVFAVWMARQETDLGDLPALLERQRDLNRDRIDAIVDRYAATHGWPAQLARHYLDDILRYTIDRRELEAIERFAAMADRLGLIPGVRPMVTESGADTVTR